MLEGGGNLEEAKSQACKETFSRLPHVPKCGIGAWPLLEVQDKDYKVGAEEKEGSEAWSDVTSARCGAEPYVVCASMLAPSQIVT